jgi:hypothetical protein
VIQMNWTATGGGHHDPALLVIHMNGTVPAGGHHERQRS